MTIGFIGLGKMGSGMSIRLAAKGHDVHGYDATPESRVAPAEAGVKVHESREELLESLGDQKVVWLMIPSQFVTKEAEELIEMLPSGSILIDGGNSPFRESMQLGKEAAEKGVNFIDIGVSGGLVGADQGYAMMAGGDKAAFEIIEPAIKDMCQPRGYGYFGTYGAGHFVKMVHNAIEYGMMEAFAEGFELIENGPFEQVDLAKLADVWQHGSIIQSFLNSLAVEIFTENRDLKGIEGKVNMLGEAQWANEYAQEIGIDLRVVDAAVKRRGESQEGKVSFATKYLAATRNKFGGHSLNKISAEQAKDTLRNA